MADWSVLETDLARYLRGNRWLVQNGHIEKAHAILCDPPYALPGGFMSKDWDAFHSPQAFEAWVTEWAELLIDFVHPGAVGLFFGGTRTYHRLAAGLEDAGWDIADCLMWVYGCLSEDTEILTEDGWVLYHKAIEGKRVLCYNVEHDTYTWQPIQDRVVYEYADTAYRIVSDRTDQLVSRNHRCIVERGGKLVFRYAETLQSEERVPVLESVPEVRGDLSVHELDAGQAQSFLRQELFGLVVGTHKEVGRGTGADAGNVRDLRQAVLQAECVGSQGERTSLQPGVQREVAGEGTSQAFAQGARGLDRSITIGLYREDDRREQSSMEGRRYVLPKARQLQADKVRALSAGIYAYGTQGRLRDGAPLDRRAGDRALSVALGGGASHQPRSARQSAGQPRTVRLEPGTQTLRSARNTPTDLARVEPVHYVGKVWCVRVPTGAFVARRNGKMFVTGNSGFPKSLDLSKAIDKEAGAVREVVGERVRLGDKAAYPYNASSNIYGKDNDHLRDGMRPPVTAPATPLAARWEGYGTAAKPAWEPCVVARAPRGKHTYAALAREFGTGALAIDASRIETVEAEGRALRSTHGPVVHGDESGHLYSKRQLGSRAIGTTNVGRWPANFGLVCACEGDDHADDCPVRVLGAQSGVLTSGKREPSARKNHSAGWHMASNGNEPSTGDASRFFYQAKAAAWEREAGLAHRTRQIVSTSRPNSPDKTGKFPDHDNRPRLNVHPTVKPIRLAEYLARLILPPEGDEPRRLLVPFAGSGSEMIGALLAGWDVVTGIEREAEYVALARARVGWWAQFATYDDARKAYEQERKAAPQPAGRQVLNKRNYEVLTCPEHGEKMILGLVRRYACGCPLQYGKREPVTALPEVTDDAPGTQLPLFDEKAV